MKTATTKSPRDEGDTQLLPDVHPVIFKTILVATLWFIAAIFLLFAWDSRSFYALGVVVAFTAIATGLVMLTASYTLDDPRWRTRRKSLRSFRKSWVPVATGSLRGSHVIVQILLLPVALALAMTAIGVIWSVMH